jgi:hypothetical protein
VQGERSQRSIIAQKIQFLVFFRCPNKFPYLCERSAWSDQAPRPVTTTATTTTTTTTVTTTTKEPVPPCTSLTLPARHNFFYLFVKEFFSYLHSFSHRVHTQNGDGRFLAYIPSMMEKSALAGDGGGRCRPTPFFSAYYVPSRPKLQCYAPAERAETPPLFQLYPICTLWFHS